MLKSLFMGVVAALAGASLASAATLTLSDTTAIQAPNHPSAFNYVVGTTGLITVDVLSSGNEATAGTNVFAQLGDGGSDIGGINTSPPYPHFTDIVVSAAGHIFGATDPTTDATVLPLAVVRTSTSSSGTRVNSGTLATLSIDLTGVPVGAYVLSLQNVPQGFQTDILNAAGDPFPATVRGVATINVLPVPEPATALLLIGALPFMRRRRSA